MAEENANVENTENVNYEELAQAISEMASDYADAAEEKWDMIVNGVGQMVDAVLEKDEIAGNDGAANDAAKPDNFIVMDQAIAMDELIEKGAFKVSEMEERGIDPNDMFMVMASLGYDDTVPVYYAQEPGQEGFFSMSEIYGEGIEVTQIDNQEQMDQKLEEITAYEDFENMIRGVRNGDERGLNLTEIAENEDFTDEQKNQLIDAMIEKNRELINISEMSPQEALNEMDIVKQQMDQISGGQFSEYQNVVGNWGIVDSDDPDHVYWNDVHNDLRSTTPEYRELDERLEALKDAHRRDGIAQSFVREIREVRPEALEKFNEPAPENNLWNNDAFNMK